MTAALNEAAVAACGAAANYHEDTDWSEVARAVLMAVREPGDSALSAGSNEGGYDGYRQVQNTPDIWRAMIDAILNEETK